MTVAATKFQVQINPHAWRKFEQAQRNMLRHFLGRRRRQRRTYYWVRQFAKRIDGIFK